MLPCLHNLEHDLCGNPGLVFVWQPEKIFVLCSLIFLHPLRKFRLEENSNEVIGLELGLCRLYFLASFMYDYFENEYNRCKPEAGSNHQKHVLEMYEL